MRLLLVLSMLLAVTMAIVYKDNAGGRNATFPAFSINGNFNSNGQAPRKCPRFDMSLTVTMFNLNNEIVYRLIDSAEFQFDIIDNVDGPITGQCNGVPFEATNVGGDSYSADVTDAVIALSDPLASNELECCWDNHVVSPGRDRSSGSAPRVLVNNRPIQRTLPSGWRHFVDMDAGNGLDYDITVAYLQTGDCNVPDTITWLLHPQPAQSTTLVALLKELELQSANDGKKRCFIAMDQFGSGYTRLRDAAAQGISVLPEELWDNALALSQRFLDEILRPLNPAAPIDWYGFEWNSRIGPYLAPRNPGALRDLGYNTAFINPCSAATTTKCQYAGPINITAGNYIISQKLVARAAELGFPPGVGLFPCDPNVPANLPDLLGPDFLDDDELCGPNSIHSCTASCSDRGELEHFVTNIQVGPGVYIPSLHTFYDFVAFLTADNAVGPATGFNIRCNQKFGPGGFATAQGFNALFNLRDLSPEEIEMLNEPHEFPGLGTDATLVGIACASAQPGNVGPSLMPQPHLAQAIATTVTPNPDEATPGPLGLTPAQSELPLARALYDEGQSLILSKTLGNYITGDLVLLASDVSPGILAGDEFDGIHRDPKFQWQRSVANVEIYRSLDHVIREIGDAGGHTGGPMDQPDVMAYQILEQIRSHE